MLGPDSARLPVRGADSDRYPRLTRAASSGTLIIIRDV